MCIRDSLLDVGHHLAGVAGLSLPEGLLAQSAVDEGLDGDELGVGQCFTGNIGDSIATGMLPRWGVGFKRDWPRACKVDCCECV